jgi:class 3 adenylate cyclase
VVAGSVGARERLQYMVVGQPANLAARLEALGKTLSKNERPGWIVLLDRAAVDLLEAAHHVTMPVGQFSLTGIADDVEVSRLTDRSG